MPGVVVGAEEDFQRERTAQFSLERHLGTSWKDEVGNKFFPVRVVCTEAEAPEKVVLRLVK